jgi:hypothetical protein
MNCIELCPNLSHCIQTVAREEFWNSVSVLMASDQENDELQQRVQLLKAFLESMDFRELRRLSEEHLTQGRTVKFVVYWDKSKPSYEMIVS